MFGWWASNVRLQLVQPWSSLRFWIYWKIQINIAATREVFCRSDVLEPFIRGQRDFCCLGFHTLVTPHHPFRRGIIENSHGGHVSHPAGQLQHHNVHTLFMRILGRPLAMAVSLK